MISDAGFQAAEVDPKSAAAGALVGASALIVISEAAGGKGGVQPEAMKQLMASVPDDGSLLRLVYLSTHGVERTDKMPFNMQNLFGQLDKLRAAEQEVQLRALKRIASYTVVRVGSKLVEDEADACAVCELAPGDALQGDAPASAVGGVLVQTLSLQSAINATLSAAPMPGGAGSTLAGADAEAHWDDQWLKLSGPEVYRRGLVKPSAADTAIFLREWSQGFLKDGQQLTTPIELEEVEDGVQLRFMSKGGGYRDFDDEETDDEKWAAASAAAKGKKPRATSDGALLIVAEAASAAAGGPRVRVARAEMEIEGGGTRIVKEMSESEVLTRLDKGLDAFEKAQR